MQIFICFRRRRCRLRLRRRRCRGGGWWRSLIYNFTYNLAAAAIICSKRSQSTHTHNHVASIYCDKFCIRKIQNNRNKVRMQSITLHEMTGKQSAQSTDYVLSVVCVCGATVCFVSIYKL